jgi:hypothetical protein
MPSLKNNKEPIKSAPEIPLDQLINELISKRKIQQEALLKIKASVVKKQSQAPDQNKHD